jgi:glycosyltransferase involved in cell wall biosynthesis
MMLASRAPCQKWAPTRPSLTPAKKIIHAIVRLQEAQMKIIFVNRLFGVRFGGGEQVDALYAAELSKRGHNVTILMGIAFFRGLRPGPNLPGVRQVLIRTPYLRDLHYWSKRVPQNQWAQKIGYWLGERLDIALFQHAVRRWIVAQNERADWFQISSLPELASWIEREGLGRAAVAWHGPIDAKRDSQLLSTYALNWGSGGMAYESLKGFDPRAKPIPNGIEPDRFQPITLHNKVASRHRLSLSQDDLVFLFVGRLVPIKNIPLMLEAFAMLHCDKPSYRLLIVGEGESQNSLVAFARKLGLEGSVKFLGAVAGNALVDCYHAADIFCISSRYENFSIVVLEAMASSLPVIATRVGFLPSLVEDGKTGLLVDGESTADFSAAMMRLGSDVQLCRLMGAEASRRAYANFPLAASVDALLSAYKNSYVPLGGVAYD